jgi:predicted transcriptional regulator
MFIVPVCLYRFQTYHFPFGEIGYWKGQMSPLTKCRQELGITQRELGRRLGLSKDAIWRAERVPAKDLSSSILVRLYRMWDKEVEKSSKKFTSEF